MSKLSHPHYKNFCFNAFGSSFSDQTIDRPQICTYQSVPENRTESILYRVMNIRFYVTLPQHKSNIVEGREVGLNSKEIHGYRKVCIQFILTRCQVMNTQKKAKLFQIKINIDLRISRVNNESCILLGSIYFLVAIFSNFKIPPSLRWHGSRFEMELRFKKHSMRIQQSVYLTYKY